MVQLNGVRFHFELDIDDETPLEINLYMRAPDGGGHGISLRGDELAEAYRLYQEADRDSEQNSG